MGNFNFNLCNSPVIFVVNLKKCPGWVDPGTRGCPIPCGAVLAGASQRNNAMWLSIIDLCYEQDPDEPVQLRLPIIVQSLMMYDV